MNTTWKNLEEEVSMILLREFSLELFTLKEKKIYKIWAKCLSKEITKWKKKNQPKGSKNRG